MQVTATEAKNRFGYVCSQAKKAPVFVEKDGRVESVILSVEDFEALKSASQNQTASQRQKVFDQNHADWLAEQQQRFDKHGVWCDDLRTW